MVQDNAEISHVSDTAFWVAAYRAIESDRPDALFHDPFVKLLLDERAYKLAKQVPHSEQVALTVVMRTLIIDDYISLGLAQGVDHVLNLGAGLDTRPYRLDLPATLRWTEVDHPNIVELKNSRLAGQPARCQLNRVACDLAERKLRQELFRSIGQQSKKIFVIAEGLIYYLSNEQVAELSDDLRDSANVGYWALGYLSPDGLKRFKERVYRRQLKQSPFVFDPPDWRSFFESRGWKLEYLRYIISETKRRGRRYPYSWPIRFFKTLIPIKYQDRLDQYEGYGLLKSV